MRNRIPSEGKSLQRHKADFKPVQAKLSGTGSGNRFDLSQLGAAQSMPAPVQAKMEESLGADFSGVRLYESPMISDNGAQAVASGNNVAFAPGKLDFSSKAGLGLLGHELSHVASQARGEVSGSGFVNNPALEHKADEDGERAASAFDSGSGHTLSPMSAGGGSFSTAAPMQAKKGKTPEPEPEPVVDQGPTSDEIFANMQAMSPDDIAEDMFNYHQHGIASHELHNGEDDDFYPDDDLPSYSPAETEAFEKMFKFAGNHWGGKESRKIRKSLARKRNNMIMALGDQGSQLHATDSPNYSLQDQYDATLKDAADMQDLLGKIDRIGARKLTETDASSYIDPIHAYENTDEYRDRFKAYDNAEYTPDFDIKKSNAVWKEKTGLWSRFQTGTSEFLRNGSMAWRSGAQAQDIMKRLGRRNRRWLG